MTDHLKWRISSLSANGGSCVAVATTDTGVLVRNSNRPSRGTISLSLIAMAAFVDACRDGEFDE